MKRMTLLTILALTLVAIAPKTHADAAEETLLFSDDFERSESSDDREQPGNGWGTNSKSRAKGNKQVDLADGALHIVRHPVADHGVSVTQDIPFKNATISMRFKIGPQDDLGINIADMNEKSVHAGHICMAKVRLDRVEMTDLKTGRMNLDRRTRRLENNLTDADKTAIKEDTEQVAVDLDADQWHDLKVTIDGDLMTVAIDGREIGSFRSDGIGHATKSRIRLAVNREAWVDDVRVASL